MNIQERITLFTQLGQYFSSLKEDELSDLAYRAGNENSWFTEKNVINAIKGISYFLDNEILENWISKYSVSNKSLTIGIIMAGNIPMVGFHDLLCVFMSGHRAMIKTSSQDSFLIKHILVKLNEIDPRSSDQFLLVDQLKGMDAIIATGSDNTSRYFEYYFSKYPHIIRKNRTSVAILTGDETETELSELGSDIFLYYGLGCRNVSKVFVPKGYDFTPLLDGLKGFEDVIHHHKYRNNYDYNKSIYLVNKEPFLDTEFLLVRESEDMVSPISVLFYQEYDSNDDLTEILKNQSEKIQCVVGNDAGMIAFGQAQQPEVTDYADGVDTMAFLTGLK